jgi:metallo-beta-lactamase family protein
MHYTLGFFGAAQTVTGSKFLLSSPLGFRVLIDCGMFQGRGSDTDRLNRHFGFDPAQVDVVLLTHAHIDHSGLLPRLVAGGFRGLILCTQPTHDLCKIMLADSAHIQEMDARFLNKRRLSKGKRALEPLYTIDKVNTCLEAFRPIDLNEWTELNEEIAFRWIENGHILGSSAIELLLKRQGKDLRLVFSGDVGRYQHSILKPPAAFPPPDYMICESTYGDENHPEAEVSIEKLRQVVERTCLQRKGKIIIPAFSLGRTQELVLALNKLVEDGLLPAIPTFVDSPLSASATAVVRKYPSWYNDELKNYRLEDPDPFGFESLTYIREKADSMKLNSLKGPAIIIAASGMAEAGRVKHHLRNHIENPDNAVLLVGYAEPGSLAGRLLAGQKEVSIFGEMHQVRAEVVVFKEYSAHAGQNELLRYLSSCDRSRLKKLFLVHGEQQAQQTFKEVLLRDGYSRIEIPEMGETVELK